MQCAQPLVSRSRPSWSRDGFEKARIGADVGPRSPGPERAPRREPVGCGPGGGCRAVLQESRGPVSTALTLTIPPSVPPAAFVGILRFLGGARRRCGTDVSTTDTVGPPGDPGGGVGCIPREPNSVQVAPDWSRLRITADSQVADRGLRCATGTSCSPKGRWSYPSRLGGNAVLGGQVRCRSGADRTARCFGVPVGEAREKPVSKGTGRAGHLRFRVMRRLD